MPDLPLASLPQCGSTTRRRRAFVLLIRFSTEPALTASNASVRVRMPDLALARSNASIGLRCAGLDAVMQSRLSLSNGQMGRPECGTARTKPVRPRRLSAKNSRGTQFIFRYFAERRRIPFPSLKPHSDRIHDSACLVRPPIS